MTFNVTMAGTKADKTDWAAGDVVYVFFNGLKAKYLSLTYNGTVWENASEGGTLMDSDFSELSDRTLTAVHFPVAVDVSFAETRFSFTKDGEPVYNYYLFQTGKEYEVDGTTVNATLELSKPEGVAQFHVADIQDAAADYFFSSSEILPVACAAVETDGIILEKVQEAGSLLSGVADADGVVFGGRLRRPGRAAEYKFVLNGPDKIYKLERSKKALSAGTRYNFPAPASWDVVANASFDFLHLLYYTFNTKTEQKDVIQKFDFEDNDGSVVWWTQANPSYFTETDATQTSVSSRYALAKFDMSYINLAELAFTVVDGEDNIMEDEEISKAGLTVKFAYVDPDLGKMELPELSRTDDLKTYADLWVDNTVFYFRTNEKRFIPMVGKLFLKVDGEEYELPTRFSRPKAMVKHPETVLDYSSYAVVGWKPFKAPSAQGILIQLDEHTYYRVPLFTGMELKDNRPQKVSYYVIKNGEWVTGNVTSFDPMAGTYSEGGNGYIKDVMSKDAYQLSLSSYDYDYLDVPAELRKLLSVKYSADGETFADEQDADGSLTPYIVFDYNSQIEFRGTISLPVCVTVESPWQKPLVFEYNVTIKGYSD